MERQILEILLSEGLSSLMATHSSFQTSFIIQLLERSTPLSQGQREQPLVGYPSRPFLRRIAINLWHLSQENRNYRLPSYHMSGIVEIFPLDSHRQIITDLLERIVDQSRISSTHSSFQYLLKFLSWFQFFSRDRNQICFPLDSHSNMLCLPKLIFSEFLDFLNTLGPRGLLYLLGVRTTIGSVNIIPLDRSSSLLST
jgi:hypothetical protein